MSHTTRTSNWKGYLILLLLAVIWGSSFILIKRSLLVYNAWEVGALRTFIAGFVLLPFAWKAWHRLEPKARRACFSIGINGSLLPALLFALAQQRIDSATSGVLNALTPLFVLLIGRMLFGHTLRLIEIIGVVVGLGGTTLLLIKEGWTMEAYALFAIVATICYGININLTHKHVKNADPLALAVMSLVFMLPLALSVLLYTGFIQHFITDAPKAWWAFSHVAFLGVMGTAFAFFIFNRLIASFGGLFGSLVTYLIPVVAMAWGLWDGEILRIAQGIGIVFILLGVYLTKPKQKSNTQPKQKSKWHKPQSTHISESEPELQS